jgi:hypothetical protein
MLQSARANWANPKCADHKPVATSLRLGDPTSIINTYFQDITVTCIWTLDAISFTSQTPPSSHDQSAARNLFHISALILLQFLLGLRQGVCYDGFLHLPRLGAHGRTWNPRGNLEGIPEISLSYGLDGIDSSSYIVTYIYIPVNK